MLLLLALTATSGPWITAGLAVVAAVVGRLVGPFVGRSRLGALGGAVLVGRARRRPDRRCSSTSPTAAGVDEWGGFMLNLFLALCSIVLCFPLGVLLALGRRSKLPLIRLVSTAYIELFRGAPLFVLLLLANVGAAVLRPGRPGAVDSRPGRSSCSRCSPRAYMAEIVRGGLQSVPRGQIEAAKALGLSPVRQTVLIVLPQALRNVIPAQIGQLISLFKDTTLAGAAMALFELFNVARAAEPAQERSAVSCSAPSRSRSRPCCSGPCRTR